MCFKTRMARGTDIQIAQSFDITGDFLAGRIRHELSPDDLSHLESSIADERRLKDREKLVTRGETLSRSAILVSGFMFRTLERGGQRYIVGIHLPGDFVDLHGLALGRLDHDVVAAGPAKVGFIEHEALDLAMAERPGIARALWFATLLDAAIHRRWIQMLEQLDAPRRIAHIFCEVQTRLGMVGKTNARAARTPFTQTDLADMCGVSAVHANRAVSRLREMELAEIRRGTLYTKDWEALREYASFEPSYLYANNAKTRSPVEA